METRCNAAEKEVTELRKEFKEMSHDNLKMTRENNDFKDQMRVINENLKRQTELQVAHEREARALNSENKTLKNLMETFKRDAE